MLKVEVLNLFRSVNKKKGVWYVIPIIVVTLLIAITIEVHNNQEKHIKETLLKDQIEIQQTVTEAIANNISSEMRLILAEMKILASSDELQKDLGTAASSKLIQETFQKMNSIAPTVQILAIDDNAEVLSQVSRHHAKLVGKNLKWDSIFMDEDQKSLESKIGVIRGHPFKGVELFIITPVIENENGLPKGFLVVTLPPDRFFARHGNIYDLDSQFIVVLDRSHTYVSTPTEQLIGKNFFDESSQEHFGYNEVQNEQYKKVFSGNFAYALYDYGLGERLNTGYPISIEGNDEFFLFVITPTSTIYGEVGELVFADKVQTSLLIVVIAVILGILLFSRTKAFEKENLATIGQLSSNIAHDMRNPLGAVKSSTRRIQNQNNKISNQVISDETLRIDRAVKRMSHQIEGVLNYVRSTPIIPTEISVREMLNYSLDIVNVPENINVTLPENDVTIQCDSEKIENVFVNLILNAVQAIDNDTNGSITIKLEEKTSNVKIEFENSGPPIPNDKLPHIFKPLFTTKLKGTGLGLSGCKNIIEQHKGKISATSNPVVFTITLPKKIDDKSIERLD
ncbi:MAG: sensor histidine kinase [Nitrosopumilus sp.]|nr:sensor histidine kinase [Nitrosopumilus sp.]